MDQIFDEEEAELLKGYILQKPRKPTETIFGIFIGYTITYDGTSDTNDVYAKKVIEENIKQVMKLKSYIIKKIKEYRISNYEFNFYFLPFHIYQKVFYLYKRGCCSIDNESSMEQQPLRFSYLFYKTILYNVLNDLGGNLKLYASHVHGSHVTLVEYDDQLAVLVDVEGAVRCDGFEIPFRGVAVQPVGDILVCRHLFLHLLLDVVADGVDEVGALFEDTA